MTTPATIPVTYTSTNYTVNEDTEPDVDDDNDNNPGTSDYVCSVAVLAVVCGVGVLAKKK